MIPDDLQEAFDAYERALAADDVAALDDAVRARAGHAARRQQRPARRPRRDQRVPRRPRRHRTPRAGPSWSPRRLADDCWLIVATVALRGRRDGAADARCGSWPTGAGASPRRTSPGRTPSFDRSVWRTVGDPLYRARSRVRCSGAPSRSRTCSTFAAIASAPATRPGCAEAAREREHAPAVLDAARGAAPRCAASPRPTSSRTRSPAPTRTTAPRPTAPCPARCPAARPADRPRRSPPGRPTSGSATDTAGSIRVPASYQGLWGLRTTHGRSRGRAAAARADFRHGRLADPGRRDAAQAAGHLGLEADAPLLPARRVVPRRGPAGGRAGRPRGVRRRRPRATVEEIDVGPLDELFEAFRVRAGGRGVARARRVGDGASRTRSAPASATGSRARASVTAADEASARAEVERLADAIRALVDEAVLLLPSTSGPAPARHRRAPRTSTACALATLRLTAPRRPHRPPGPVASRCCAFPSALGPAPVGLCLVGPAAATST